MAYVERNPIRAGIVDRPEQWPWSSARMHLFPNAWPQVGLRLEEWSLAFSFETWREFLEQDRLEVESLLRVYTSTGWALGDEEYRRHLKEVFGIDARPLSTGIHR